MGIRLPRRNDEPLRLRRRPRRRLHVVLRQFRRQDARSRVESAQRLGPLRHAWQCAGDVPRNGGGREPGGARRWIRLQRGQLYFVLPVRRFPVGRLQQRWLPPGPHPRRRRGVRVHRQVLHLEAQGRSCLFRIHKGYDGAGRLECRRAAALAVERTCGRGLRYRRLQDVVQSRGVRRREGRRRRDPHLGRHELSGWSGAYAQPGPQPRDVGHEGRRRDQCRHHRRSYGLASQARRHRARDVGYRKRLPDGRQRGDGRGDLRLRRDMLDGRRRECAL